MAAISITVAEFDADLASNTHAPSGDYYVITDTAAKIEKLGAANNLISGRAIGLRAITATNAPVVLTATQAVQLANTEPQIPITVPIGDTVTVADTIAHLLAVSPAKVTGNPGWAGIGISAVTIVDTAKHIEHLSFTQINLAKELGVTKITSSAGTVTLSIAEALNLENAAIKVEVPTGLAVVLSGTVSKLEGLTTDQISGLLTAGVTEISATGDARPVFNIGQEDALATARASISPVLSMPLTVSQLLSYETNPSGFATPGDTYYVSDTAAHIETLTPAQMASAPIPVTAIVSTSGSVVLSMAQALALESATLPVSVATAGDRVTVIDLAATEEALSVDQLQALHAIGVDSIAASDTVPVFSATQMSALGHAAVAVIAPPGSIQNDGTTTISGPAGNGMKFDITWDSSVASAPANYQAEVEQAFQFYADTFSSSVTLYFNVGFGEAASKAMPSGDLGRSNWTSDVSEPYSTVLSQLTKDATSTAQKLALASLPATDPTGSPNISMPIAEPQILGFANVPTSSAAVPDGSVGFSDIADFNYSSDPNQVPEVGEYDFFGSVEHEISEVMGRDSFLNTSDSLMDLFRYAAPGQRQLSNAGNPSYFSVDNGVTNLDPDVAGQPPVSWNNRTINDSGDLGDWGKIFGGAYTPDAFNNGSDSDIVNPFTSSDATLMNVLGYDLATPAAVPLPPNAVALTVGELLTDVSLDQISPGSNRAPASKFYDIVDTAFDIESVTSNEFTSGTAIGVAAIDVTDGPLVLNAAQAGALAGLVAITVPSGDTVTVVDTAANVMAMSAVQLAGLWPLGVRGIIAVDGSVAFNIGQALALENLNQVGAPPIPVTVPAGDTVTLADNAEDIELLTPAEISALPGIGITAATSSDAVELSVALAEAFETASLAVTVPTGESVTLVDTAADIEDMSVAQRAALPSIGMTAITVSNLAPVSWAKDVSGNWTEAADWSPAKVPGGASAVTIAAAGTKKYTVTTAADVTVYSVATAATATLNVTGGTLNLFDGTGSGTNSGVIKIEAGATLELAGSFDSTSSGQIVAESAGAQIDLEGASLDGGGLRIAGGATMDAAAGSSTVAGGTLTNAGTLQAIGAGALMISDAVTNTGTIQADGGNVAVLGKLSGAGQAEIFGTSTLEFGAAAANAVKFESGSTGALKLDAAESFSGTVAGLASGDSIDLADFAFANGPKIIEITGTGAVGTPTDVTIKDGALHVILQLVNQMASEFSNNASAYSLTPDNNNPTHGTMFQLAVPAV